MPLPPGDQQPGDQVPRGWLPGDQVPSGLPTSRTGRTPQWVVDEAAGLPALPAAWRADAPAQAARARTRTASRPARRLRTLLTVVLVVVAAVVGSQWWTTGSIGLPRGAISALLPHATPSVPPPSAEIVALATEAHLSDAGRALFYGARPEVLGAHDFVGRCADGPTQLGAGGDAAGGGRVGCFRPDVNSIVLYAPADARLHPSVVISAAHETLHAAWATLTPDEQAALTPLLEAELAALPGDDPIREQLAGSIGQHPENRPTELFAYLGSQVSRPGGLAPQLETVWARFLTDRAGLVAVHTTWTAMLTTMGTDIDAASQGLVAHESANAQARQQLAADTASVASYRTAYQDQADEIAALPADQAQRTRLSWVWWDGTKLPMAPAETTLAAAAALLARDEAALPARESAVAAEEALAATERAHVDALIADLNALQAQLDPAGAPG